MLACSARGHHRRGRGSAGRAGRTGVRLGQARVCLLTACCRVACVCRSCVAIAATQQARQPARLLSMRVHEQLHDALSRVRFVQRSRPDVDRSLGTGCAEAPIVPNHHTQSDQCGIAWHMQRRDLAIRDVFDLVRMTIKKAHKISQLRSITSRGYSAGLV